MSETTRRAPKWKDAGDSSSERRYGPLTATIYRQWGAVPLPTGYRVCLSTGFEAFIPMSDVCTDGVEWFDDKAMRNACRIADRLIKAEIRSWLK